MKKILLSSIASMVLAGSLCAVSSPNTKNSNAYTGVLPQGGKVLLNETFVIAKDYNSKPLIIDKVSITTIPGSNGQCKLQIDSTRYEHTTGKDNGFTTLIAKDTVENKNQTTHTFLCPSSSTQTSSAIPKDLFRYGLGAKDAPDANEEIHIFTLATTTIHERETILRYTKTSSFSLEQSKFDDGMVPPHALEQKFVIQTSFKDFLDPKPTF